MTSSLEAWGSKVFLVKHFNYLKKKGSNFLQPVTPAQAYKCCAHVIWFLLFHLLFSFHIQLVCSREEHQWGTSLLEKLWMHADTNRKQIRHISPGRNAVILGFSGIIIVTMMEICRAEFHHHSWCGEKRGLGMLWSNVYLCTYVKNQQLRSCLIPIIMMIYVVKKVSLDL